MFIIPTLVYLFLNRVIETEMKKKLNFSRGKNLIKNKPQTIEPQIY